MMASQILKSVNFTKTQKSRYLENDIFFLQIKKFIDYTSRATLWQKNNFVVEVTFNLFRTSIPSISIIFSPIRCKPLKSSGNINY